MSESNAGEWAEPVEPSEYGQQRRAAWLAEGRARAQTMMDMLSGGGQQDHQAAHDHITRSKHGIFGAMTPQELGQAAADRQASVGGEWGHARPLERNGHLADSIGPAPHRVYRSQVNEYPGYQQSDDRPILRHLRGER
jgi:hypothetical protein